MSRTTAGLLPSDPGSPPDAGAIEEISIAEDASKKTSSNLSRRRLLSGLVAGGVTTLGAPFLGTPSLLGDESENTQPAPATPAVTRGNLKQSLCAWCMGLPLERLAELAQRLGVPSIEILKPDQFPIIQKYGLVCAMTQLDGADVIGRGLNRIEHHESYLAMMRSAIAATHEAGFPNVICFSGNRAGLSDDEGLENCAAGLKQIVGEAEKSGIILCMELLNSKEHKDYMCDRTEWGVELVDRVGSDNFKLLYDIYHMQRMEGDVIATLRKYKDYIAHYHTAGNPGRSNLDDTQELQYGAICKAILETGYKGYLGQEFYPRGGEIAIRQAVELCDV